MSAEAAASRPVPQLVWLAENQLSRKDFPRTGFKALVLGYHMSDVPAFRSFYEQAVPQGLFLLGRNHPSGRKHMQEYCIVPASLTYDAFWREFEFHEGSWRLVYPEVAVPFVEHVVAVWKTVDQGSSKWASMAAIMLDAVFSSSAEKPQEPSPTALSTNQ